MKHIAKALAAQGRGPDDSLLHVSKNELKHLAGLAGLKELPRNPKTGLPEAGLFESILPIVGGVGGAMLLGPAGAAIGSGLGTALGGGSNQDILRNAAIGGIGAGLVGAGGSATDKIWMAPEGADTAQAIGQAAQATQAVPSAATEMFGPTATQAPWVDTGGMYTAAANPAAITAPTAVTPTAVTPTASPSFMSKALNWAGEHPMQAGILGLTAANALSQPSIQNPQPHRVEMKGQSHSNRTYTGGVPAAGASPYAERNYFANNTPYSYTQDPSTYEMRYAEGGEVQPQGYQHTQFQSAYQPGLNTQVAPGTESAAMKAAFQQPAAQSGIGSLAGPSAPTGGINYSDPNWYANAVGQSAAANPDTVTPALSYGNKDVMGRLKDAGLGYLTAGMFVPGMSKLGHATGDFVSNTLGSLGGALGFAKGGKLNLRAPAKHMDPIFLKGAGDGMSDSIPAYIDGGGVRPHEPIRVADGEYVLSSDVVSALGGGSSDAGARKLDSMVDGIRRTAHGRKSQIKPVQVSITKGKA